VKIAVALDEGLVSPHFGHAPHFAIYETNGDGFSRQLLPNPGHEPGKLPVFLHGEGVSCIIAGGMGPRAVALFGDHGIDVVLGVSGPADDAVTAFLAGTLARGESMCHHPHEECDH
jgi:predicted Fe-Mo cluster-binding NifX family protein